MAHQWRNVSDIARSSAAHAADLDHALSGCGVLQPSDTKGVIEKEEDGHLHIRSLSVVRCSRSSSGKGRGGPKRRRRRRGCDSIHSVHALLLLLLLRASER